MQLPVALLKLAGSTRFQTSVVSVALLAATAAPVFAQGNQEPPPNPFTIRENIGKQARPGFFIHDSSVNSFVLEGGGKNIWETNDHFFFACRPISGDVALRASVEWLSAGGHPHRKACLMIRQSLELDSPYVDVALHGDGLSSMQFRDTKGGLTREIQFANRTPALVSIERQSNTFYVRAGADDKSLAHTGAFIRLALQDPVYVGLAVCSHDPATMERARFTNVQLDPRIQNPKLALHSTLEVVSIASGDRKVVYHAPTHFEAPNWSPDGTNFLFNSKGRIYRLPVSGGEPALVNTDFAEKCNNDHGISADGKTLIISDSTKTGKSQIYTLPIEGGTPQLVTENGPSYWHGISPDGKTLVYCAERNGEYDVYSIPTAGGQETRLTDAKGLDDGPEFSPDGKFIYFNSDRTGTMQIWRMQPDGKGQEQVTKDEYNNWFAHPSPDGKWLVFLSYEKDVNGHPPDKPVTLRLMPTKGGTPQVLARLFGGQGTINVPSWSPDSKNVAFVSYEYLP